MFAGSAYAALNSAGAARIVTSDTIAHPGNRIDVSGLLAQGAREIWQQAE